MARKERGFYGLFMESGFCTCWNVLKGSCLTVAGEMINSMDYL